jgi:tRNA (guanine-N7-)-methyltransferase
MSGTETGHRRSIRSFVRRTGRLTASQQKALEDLWPQYGLDAVDAPLDLEAIYGRTAPVTLEIGFGNGDSLAAMAAAEPERDFLGVEVHEPGVGHCLIRIRELGLKNLRLVRHDAIEVLENAIPAQALARINLYFPDPWPKKRHHKRRIVEPRFLALCAKALAPAGTLHIATDWPNYAGHIEEMLAASPDFNCREQRVHDGEAPLARPRTKFEQRGLRHGHRIHDWIFVLVQ